MTEAHQAAIYKDQQNKRTSKRASTTHAIYWFSIIPSDPDTKLLKDKLNFAPFRKVFRNFQNLIVL